ADGDGRHRVPVLLHAALDGLSVRPVHRKPEREGQTAAVAENARDELRASPGLVALDVLEEQRRAFLLEHTAGDRAELAVPVHLGGDPAQLTVLVEPAEPLTQNSEGHRRSPL